MPTFRVWREDVGESAAREIREDSARLAAELFAERTDYESADFDFAKGSDAVVCVENVDDIVGIGVRRFTIESVSRPSYIAREKR